MNKEQGDEIIKELDVDRDVAWQQDRREIYYFYRLARPFLKVLVDIAKNLEFIAKLGGK